MVLSDDILKKIEEEKIKPAPRWMFLLKDWVYWASFVLSVLLGSIGASFIFYEMAGGDLQAFIMSANYLPTLVGILPLAWLVIFIFFSFVAYYQFKHVGQGYKYSPLVVIIFSLFLSALLGFAISETGTTQRFEGFAKRALPMYHTCVKRQQEAWNHPEEGLLGGRIERLYPQADFDLVDPRGRLWHVFGSNARWHHNNAGNPMHQGALVKIVGRLVEGGFEAEEIVPWGKCGCTQGDACQMER